MYSSHPLGKYAVGAHALTHWPFILLANCSRIVMPKHLAKAPESIVSMYHALGLLVYTLHYAFRRLVFTFCNALLKGHVICIFIITIFFFYIYIVHLSLRFVRVFPFFFALLFRQGVSITWLSDVMVTPYNRSVGMCVSFSLMLCYSHQLRSSDSNTVLILFWSL